MSRTDLRKLINEVSNIETVNEAPFGALRNLGNKVASTFTTGGLKQQLQGKAETGKQAQELYKEYKNYLGKTSQEDNEKSLYNFLSDKKFSSEIISNIEVDNNIPWPKNRDHILTSVIALINRSKFQQGIPDKQVQQPAAPIIPPAAKQEIKKAEDTGKVIDFSKLKAAISSNRNAIAAIENYEQASPEDKADALENVVDVLKAEKIM